MGDPHLKITKFQLAEEFVEWLNKTIADVRPDWVVNLGDTFDTHAVVRSEIMGIFKNHVDYVTKDLGIRYYYILGNHDLYKASDSKYHALQPLRDIPKFEVVDKRLDFNLNTSITMLPYIHNAKDFPNETNEILICHQDFLGADYGFIKSEYGKDPREVKANIIISGHIHKQQSLEQVTYPGSPFSQSANDIEQVKGLMLFDTETYEKKFIECPLPQWKKLVFDLSSEFTLDGMHTVISGMVDDKHHWLIEITGLKTEIISYLDSKKYKTVVVNKDVKIKTIFTDKDKKKTEIKATSMQNIMLEYIEKVYKGSISKEDVKKKALDVLERARQAQ